MSKRVDIWSINPDSYLSVSNKTHSYNWEIVNDYLNAESSTFTVENASSFKAGDLAVVKESQTSKILLNGVITGVENDTIKIGTAQTVWNEDIIASRITGDNLLRDLWNIVVGNFSRPNGMPLSNVYLIPWTSNVNYYKWSYQPKDSPNIINSVDFLKHLFKKYRVVVDFREIRFLGEYQYNQVDLGVNISDKTLKLKNNVADFVNWDVAVSPNDTGSNYLAIYRKENQDMRAPIADSNWYLNINGDLTQDLNNNVRKPLKRKAFLFDQSSYSNEQPAPTYQEIAESELKANVYSHEISVDVRLDSKLISIEDWFYLGSKAQIVYNESLYPSVLSAWKLSSESDFVTLTFGNIRSTLSDVID